MAELLEWMGASQAHDMGDEVDEEALEIGRGFSQTWESPSMEAAMLQALSRFEQATQKECQEILDCVNNDECEEDEGDEDLEAALLEIDLEDVAIVQRARTGRGGIPQIDGASDACENSSPRDLLDRYTQHLNKLKTRGASKDPHVIFRVDDPLNTVQKYLGTELRIPQNDGADGDETESDFLPEPKRIRLGSHRSTTGSKKDSHDRKEKDVSKRPGWGLLPLVGVSSSQPTTIKQEKQEPRVNKRPVPEVAHRRDGGNLRPRKEASRVAEVASRGPRTEPSTDEKAKSSEVSLRALMRRKRERRLRSKDSSFSGGSSIVGSQSEGEQSFGGMGIVKSESSIPDDSESQEQEVMKQNIVLSGQKLGIVKVKEEVEEMVAPDQGIAQPRDVRQASKLRILPLVNRDAEQVARSSQGVKIESGRGTTLQQIGTVCIYPVVEESESRSLDQRPETNQLPLKVENLLVKWDDLLETGDDRDCGGGRKPALHVQNPGGSKSIQVQSQVRSQVLEDEVWLGEDVPLTQTKESKELLLDSSRDLADEKEGMLRSGDLDVLHEADVCDDMKLVEGARQAWDEVVKEVTEYSSAKVTSHNSQVSNFDVNLSLDAGNATPQRTACEDVVNRAESLPLNVLSSQRLDLGSDEDLEHKTDFIETQLAEHEILWRMKHEVIQTEAALEAEAFEDEFLGTVLVPDKTERPGNEHYEELNESSPKLVINGNDDSVPHEEGTEAAELLFTDMSDVSEDSFDWGDEFGSFHRLDNSDVGADASDEEDFRARLPTNSSDIKPELSTHSDGIARTGSIVDEQQAAEGAPKECGDKLETLPSKSSSVSSWQVVQAKLGVGISKLCLQPEQEKCNLLGPTDGQPESTGFLDEAKGCTSTADTKEKESEADLEVTNSGKSEAKNSASQPSECSAQEVENDTLIPVKFHQKPPSRDALMATLGQCNLRGVDYGGVFYGNAKDVPGRATVSAGLIFDGESICGANFCFSIYILFFFLLWR